MIFKERERDAFYSPYFPIAIRIHIYSNFFLSFPPEENLYSPVRIVSIILALADVLDGVVKNICISIKSADSSFGDLLTHRGRENLRSSLSSH